MSNETGDLTTARLVLRPYASEDLPAFLALALDPRVTRLVGDGAAWTQERATVRWWSGMAAHQQGDEWWLKVMDRGSQEHLGVVAAHRVEQDLEVGVWITPDRWSTGLGQEALLAVLPELRRRFPAQRVVAEADVPHTASDRLLRSVGFARSHQRAGRYGNPVHHYVWDEAARKIPGGRTPGR